ncbi:CocE/NonD family hydrolase [Spirosoma sp. KCTC 42546]|uniref:CocE/NonD family hydrolase n=1 Tax=Spirosoma sp. KCTC 42546 TaxID=2520506 RepID=UPI00115ADEF3|nr:CocE/NonD family hydrolase [Spirosoma sp. KCTC 42546]QDK79943.1 CocE/NonD family hydrolase [Spirosoma sp. KCTC 42546]
MNAVNTAKAIWIVLFLVVARFTYAQQTLRTKIGEANSNYDVQDSILIRTQDGATLSAIMVRKKGVIQPLPVVLQFTIYVRDTGRDIKSLKESADNGYVGVIAYTRGKRFSTSPIYPYENEAADAYEVIDWISKQPWCNGSVGMFGGSYNGFSQWAACKKSHPALKTIVPYVANRPGMGLPMENNVFVNPNYEWSFYVGNNKYLDTLTGNDRKRFRKVMFDWWRSGAAYNKMDSIDGTPNKWFQRWISHPDFDRYWQTMAPYKGDFTQITIPVLAFDGYYNDSQNSSLYYLKELQKYNPKTPCYLVIGPYGHFGTQIGGERVINGYRVDSVALLDIKKITYQWLDYVLKNGPKPDILKDKINYEVMGANAWRSAPSLDKMNNGFLTFYLTDQKTNVFYSLSPQKPSQTGYLSQQVDFSDRQISTNNYYPDPIERKSIDTSNGFVFVSEPLTEQLLVNGSFLGQLNISINKKDVDLGLTLYELTPAGDYFHLSYYIGRASYAKDMTKRTLLKPGEITTIDFSNTHLVSKQIHKGSRLVLAVNVNKNPFSQLNYGTGKDVSTETLLDAKEPLLLKWYTSSYIKVPVWR